MKLSDYTDLEIDITSKCNLSCPLCYRYDNKPEKNFDMSINDYTRCLDLFPNLKNIYLGFLLCEPTMHKNFIEIVKITKNRGKNIVLSTNGNHGSIEMWKELCGILDHNDKIIWALDGSTQEIYEKYRVGGKLKKVLFNLQLCIDENKHINHTVQNIEFEHNKTDDICSITDTLNNINLKKISCCGDCGSPAKGIKPIWDINEWIRIKKEVYSGNLQSKTINCMTKDENIIFVTHEGVIGFCPSYLADYLKQDNRITINNTNEEIIDYINTTHNNRFSSKICQFNCGQMALKLKELKGLGKVSL